MNNALELIRAAKQLLLEERRRRPYLFSKLIPNFKTAADRLGSVPLPPTHKPAFSPSKSVEAKESLASPSEKSAIASNSSETIQSILPTDRSYLSSFKALRCVIEKSCPSLRLKEEIPSDEIALQRKNAWKRRGFDVEVLILCFGKDRRQKNLLSNIAKAIGTLGKRCQVIDAFVLEKERGWDSFLELPHLLFIIAPPLEMWQTPLIKSLVKVNPVSEDAYLGKAEVLFIPSMEKILSDTTLKPRLWHTLCQKLVLQA